MLNCIEQEGDGWVFEKVCKKEGCNTCSLYLNFILVDF